MIQNNQPLSPDHIWIERVAKMAQDIAIREGCFLYDVEFASGRILRIFIDKDQGAGVDDCSNVSKGLTELLDADDVVPGGEYHLEVSTPGIDRSLKKVWHFEKAIGQKIWLKTRTAFENFGVNHPQHLKAKQIEAVLVAVEGEKLTLETSQTQIQVPLVEIEKAKVVFEMKKNDMGNKKH